MTIRRSHGERIEFTGKLSRWTGATGNRGCFFVIIDSAAGEALSGTALMRRMEGVARGFGAIKVQAVIGGSQFSTSVFPQKGDGWLLPVKAAVRKAEALDEGDVVKVELAF